MKSRDGLYFLLTLPSVYRLFRTIVRGDACRIYVSEYVRPAPGDKVHPVTRLFLTLTSEAGRT